MYESVVIQNYIYSSIFNAYIIPLSSEGTFTASLQSVYYVRFVCPPIYIFIKHLKVEWVEIREIWYGQYAIEDNTKFIICNFLH